MSVRRLPVRPDLEQLQRQAKELLRAIHGGDADAIAELREHHPAPIDPQTARLADAQLTLARKYGASSWTRLAHSARLGDAIWRDDIESVRAIVTGNPALLHEHVLIDPDDLRDGGAAAAGCAGARRSRIYAECGRHGRLVSVSYTHLRAHETGRNLVCRLL